MPGRSATVWLALASIVDFYFSFEKDGCQHVLDSAVQHRHVDVLQGTTVGGLLQHLPDVRSIRNPDARGPSTLGVGPRCASYLPPAMAQDV